MRTLSMIKMRWGSGHKGTVLASVAMLMISGCAGPLDVNVGTDDPIEVNVSMEVHVYQYDAVSGEVSEAQQNFEQTTIQRRDRMGEVQELKNSRLIGEDHDGLLSIRNMPAGEFGLYVKKTVDEENQDRDFLMSYEAEEKGTAIGEVRRNQWRRWQRKSFPGEWIQVEGDEPDVYRWMQKKTQSGGGESAGETGSGESE